MAELQPPHVMVSLLCAVCRASGLPQRVHATGLPIACWTSGHICRSCSADQCTSNFIHVSSHHRSNARIARFISVYEGSPSPIEHARS